MLRKISPILTYLGPRSFMIFSVSSIFDIGHTVGIDNDWNAIDKIWGNLMCVGVILFAAHKELFGRKTVLTWKKNIQ
jgi:hypothetical protein